MLGLVIALLTSTQVDYDLAAKAAKAQSEAVVDKLAVPLRREADKVTENIRILDREFGKIYEPRLTASELKSRLSDGRSLYMGNRKKACEVAWAAKLLASGEIIPLADLPEFNDGAIGAAPGAQLGVVQVASSDAMIIRLAGFDRDNTAWMEGVPTDGLVDDKVFELTLPISKRAKGGIVFLSGSKTYPTAIGGTKTIRCAHVLSLTKLAEKTAPAAIAWIDADKVKDASEVISWLKAELPAKVKQLEDELAKVDELIGKAKLDDAKEIDAEFRKWESKDGKFSVEARLMVASGKSVTLEKREPEGKTIKVERTVLSDADNQFAEKFIKAEKERLARKAKQ